MSDVDTCSDRACHHVESCYVTVKAHIGLLAKQLCLATKINQSSKLLHDETYVQC